MEVCLQVSECASVVGFKERKRLLPLRECKTLPDGEEVFQSGGDPEELAVVGDVADVSQGDFLLIDYPNFKVLKKNTRCNISISLIKCINKR